MTDALSLSGPVVRFPRTSSARIRRALTIARDGAYAVDGGNTSPLAQAASQHDVEEWDMLLDCLDKQVLETK